MDNLHADIVSITYEPKNSTRTLLPSTYPTYELEHQRLLDILKPFHVVHLHGTYDYNAQLEWCFEFCTGRFRDLELNLNDGKHWFFEKSEDAF